MVMLDVIPTEEGLAKSPSILQTAESLRKIGAVLESLKLGFGIRIVIPSMGPTVRLGHPQIRKQKCDWLGLHGRPPIGMNQ
jgi:hypothetical protein